MGNVVARVLHDRDRSSPDTSPVFLDFEGAEPTDAELKIDAEGRVVLQRAQKLLLYFQDYQGPSASQISAAFSTPLASEAGRQSWEEVVLPLARKLEEFYNFSIELGKFVAKILAVLCSLAMTPTEHLESQQALVMHFAQVLDFAMKFDGYKSSHAEMQNGLGFYRRALNQIRVSGSGSALSLLIPDGNIQQRSQMASCMAVFYARFNPMMVVLGDATSKFIAELNEDAEGRQVLETLGRMEQACQAMLNTPELRQRFKSEATPAFVSRVMAGLVILYDLVNPDGAFVKASDVDVSGCIQVLKRQPKDISGWLLWAIRNNTKHFKDKTTPKQIRRMLSFDTEDFGVACFHE